MTMTVYELKNDRLYPVLFESEAEAINEYRKRAIDRYINLGNERYVKQVDGRTYILVID